MAFRKALLAVVKMLTEDAVQIAFPLHIYPVRSPPNEQRCLHYYHYQTLLESKPVYSFDANASYLIVRGLGGIDRSIARWLVPRGARNIILLSQSGASSEAASSHLAALRSYGVRVEALACDVTNYEVLARTIAQCADSGMPPIKGCIQGAMVLHVSLSPGLTHDFC